MTHQQKTPCEEPLTHASIMRMIVEGTGGGSLGDSLLKQKRQELTRQQPEKEQAAVSAITPQQIADMIAAQIAAQAARTPVFTRVPVDTEAARMLARLEVPENATEGVNFQHIAGQADDEVLIGHAVPAQTAKEKRNEKMLIPYEEDRADKGKKKKRRQKDNDSDVAQGELKDSSSDEDKDDYDDHDKGKPTANLRAKL
jgi:hypothetical protein